MRKNISTDVNHKSDFSKRIKGVLLAVVFLILLSSLLVALLPQKHHASGAEIQHQKTYTASAPPNLPYYDSYMQSGGPAILLDTATTSDEKFVDMRSKAVDLDASLIELQRMVDEVKSRVREHYHTHDYLCWDRFETAKVKYVDREYETVMAFYDDQENTLYLTRGCQNEESLKETIAHELIHALTVNDICRSSVYYEGATEFFAQQVYPTGGASYFHAYAFAEVYARHYGIERALKDFSDLSALNDIDEKLGTPGLAENIGILISYIDEGRFESFPHAVADEAYLYYAKATKIDTEITANTVDWMFKFIEACPDSDNAVSYLKSIRE